MYQEFFYEVSMGFLSNWNRQEILLYYYPCLFLSIILGLYLVINKSINTVSDSPYEPSAVFLSICLVLLSGILPIVNIITIIFYMVALFKKTKRRSEKNEHSVIESN